MKSIATLVLFVATTGDLFSQSSMGETRDGVKIGVWEYVSNDGNTELRINHTTQEILFQRADTTRYAIEKNGAWVKEKLDVRPMPIDGFTNLYATINQNLKFPEELKRKGLEGDVFVVFDVDSSGRAKNFSFIKESGHGCEQAVQVALARIQQKWIPARIENRAYPTRFILSFLFSYADRKLEWPPVPEANVLPEIELIANVIATYDNQIFSEGSIVSKQGVSIKCLINLTRQYENKVEYRVPGDKKSYFMNVQEIRSVITPFRKFENIMVDKERLMSLEVDGKLQLYKYEKPFSGTVSSTFFVLVKNNLIYEVSPGTYDNILYDLVADNFKIAERMKVKPYSFLDIPRIVYQYNNGLDEEMPGHLLVRPQTRN